LLKCSYSAANWSYRPPTTPGSAWRRSASRDGHGALLARSRNQSSSAFLIRDLSARVRMSSSRVSRYGSPGPGRSYRQKGSLASGTHCISKCGPARPYAPCHWPPVRCLRGIPLCACWGPGAWVRYTWPSTRGSPQNLAVVLDCAPQEPQNNPVAVSPPPPSPLGSTSVSFHCWSTMCDTTTDTGSGASCQDGLSVNHQAAVPFSPPRPSPSGPRLEDEVERCLCRPPEPREPTVIDHHFPQTPFPGLGAQGRSLPRERHRNTDQR
jgi:hypothetical protein